MLFYLRSVFSPYRHFASVRWQQQTALPTDHCPLHLSAQCLKNFITFYTTNDNPKTHSARCGDNNQPQAKYCQENKGLKVYGWVVMTNHVHMIISSDKAKLRDIIRDFKKYTATKIAEAISANNKESRKGWLLWLLQKEGNVLFWQEGYHGEEIITQAFFESKLHLNPVRVGIVGKEEYMYSSCADHYGLRKGLLELAIV